MPTVKSDSALNLSSDYCLTDDQVRGFRDNGHIHLVGVCPPGEIIKYRKILNKVTEKRFKGIKPINDRPMDDFSRVFMQTFNIREADNSIARLIRSHRFGKIAADLLGVKAVRIYYDKVLFKEPGSRITPWHQDAPHWPLYSDNVLTIWIPLVNVTLDMGAPRFASGTHKDKQFGPRGIADKTESFYENYIQKNGIPVVNNEISIGDVTAHNHWVVHSAGANRSKQVREAIGITFYEDGLRVDDTACDDIEKPVIDDNLGGRCPGQLADHPRNQIVFANS